MYILIYIYIYTYTYCISDFWQEKEASLLTSFDNHFVCHSLDSSTAIVVGLFACGMEWIWSCHSVTRGRGTMLPVRWCGCSSHFFFPNKLMKKWRGCIDEVFFLKILDGLAKRCKKQWSRQMCLRCSFLLGVSLPWYPGGALPTPLGDETQVRSIRTGRRD